MEDCVMQQLTRSQTDADAFWIELVNRRVCENRNRRRSYCKTVAAYLARSHFLDVVGEKGAVFGPDRAAVRNMGYRTQ